MNHTKVKPLGEMAEWSNATVLKTVVPKGTGGSNPSLSTQFKTKLKMSKKIYVRKIETWTISSASEPLEVNVEALRKCVPPYKGDSDQELVNYLQNNVWNEYDFFDDEHNKKVYGEDELYNLGMEECYTENEFSDSRTKGADESIQVGVPNEEYIKHGGFQVTANGEYEY